MLLAREGRVPRVDSVALSGESIGGFSEPGRIKQTLVMNKILWQEDKSNLVPAKPLFIHLRNY